jgi:undecaprenyl-diphosphatase
MTYLEAIILGIIQGLTEFLPVSSSGHLELAKAILGGDKVPQESLTFTVVLHFATALSTMVIFRKEILQIIRGLFQFKNNEEFTFSLKIIVSMIPAVVIGLLFEEQLEAFFDGNVLLVGFMLLITALLLLLADKAKNTSRSVSYSNAFVIGVSQAIAMLPGISRSGATISTSVLLGIDRTKAARFSFLMVVPLIFGKVGKDVMDGLISFQDESFGVMAVGFVAAFVAGLLACNWMIALVQKSKLFYFSIYCFAVGTIAIAYSYFYM